VRHGQREADFLIRFRCRGGRRIESRRLRDEVRLQAGRSCDRRPAGAVRRGDGELAAGADGRQQHGGLVDVDRGLGRLGRERESSSLQPEELAGIDRAIGQRAAVQCREVDDIGALWFVAAERILEQRLAHGEGSAEADAPGRGHERLQSRQRAEDGRRPQADRRGGDAVGQADEIEAVALERAGRSAEATAAIRAMCAGDEPNRSSACAADVSGR
jgi:hypothetical protein